MIGEPHINTATHLDLHISVISNYKVFSGCQRSKLILLMAQLTKYRMHMNISSQQSFKYNQYTMNSCFLGRCSVGQMKCGSAITV